MSTFSEAQLVAIAKVDNPFQPIGNRGTIIKYRDNGDIYIAVDGSGIIEEYNGMIGGFEFTDLDGNEMTSSDAMDIIAGLIA